MSVRPYRDIIRRKSRKIRVAGGAQSFGVSALGAVPVTINFPEIYMSAVLSAESGDTDMIGEIRRLDPKPGLKFGSAKMQTM